MLLILFALLLAISPRFILFLMWLFGSSRLDAFGSFWWPFIGFVFLPLTTLTYTLVWSASNGVSLLGWVFVGLAFMFDMSSYGFGARTRRGNSYSTKPKYVENKSEE